MNDLLLLLRHLPHLLACASIPLAGLAALSQGADGVLVMAWVRLRRIWS